MNKPTFTYDGYVRLLSSLREAGYTLTSFQHEKTVSTPRAIIRHDLDVAVGNVATIANIENGLGVSATYFVMLTSPLYNVMDAENTSLLTEIKDGGHEIGLHFDASKCADLGSINFERAVIKELNTFRSIFGFEAKSISWHIPQKELLGTSIDFLKQQSIINAYDPRYFKKYKYLSDSSARWRDNPYSFMDVEKYPLLQILTHPIWYGRTESNILQIIENQTNILIGKASNQLRSICPKLSVQEVRQSTDFRRFVTTLFGEEINASEMTDREIEELQEEYLRFLEWTQDKKTGTAG